MTDQQRIAQLEEQIAELKARLPKHTLPPSMLIQLDEMETELAALQASGVAAEVGSPIGTAAGDTRHGRHR